MNIFAPRTDEVTLDNLDRFHDAASLNLETTRDGGIRLAAPKGFISRQLDALRAIFFPSKTARQDYTNTITEVKELILKTFGEDLEIKAALDRKLPSKTNDDKILPLPTAGDMRVLFAEAKNISLLNVFKQRLLPPLEKGKQDRPEGTLSHFNYYLKKNLETNSAPLSESTTEFLKQSSLDLSQNLNDRNYGTSKHYRPGSGQLERANKSLTQTVEASSQQVENFLKENPATSSQQNSPLSPEKMNAFLENYKNQYLQPSSSQSPEKTQLRSATKDQSPGLSFAISADERATLSSLLKNLQLKDLSAYNSTLTIFNNRAISSQIADVHNDPGKFFDLLGKLSDSNQKVPSNGTKFVTPEARAILLDNLLKNFTIFKKENPSAYKLVKKFGLLLVATAANTTISTSKNIAAVKEAQQESRNILARNNAANQTVSASMSAIRKSTEAYQEYVKTQRAAGLPVTPRQDLPTNAPDVVKESLLMPEACDLMTAIDAQCQTFLDQLEPSVPQSNETSAVQSPLQDPNLLA